MANKITEFGLEVIKQFESLVEGERDFIANASNLSALIMSSMVQLNWVGIYMLDKNGLVLSTFQGKPACNRIKIGRGVCGKCVAELQTLIVDNVHNFADHIVCDSASNSEITIPLIYQGKGIGVLDLDSPEFSRFTNEDAKILEKLSEVLIQNSDIERIMKYYS